MLARLENLVDIVVAPGADAAASEGYRRQAVVVEGSGTVVAVQAKSLRHNCLANDEENGDASEKRHQQQDQVGAVLQGTIGHTTPLTHPRLPRGRGTAKVHDLIGLRRRSAPVL